MVLVAAQELPSSLISVTMLTGTSREPISTVVLYFHVPAFRLAASVGTPTEAPSTFFAGAAGWAGWAGDAGGFSCALSAVTATAIHTMALKIVFIFMNGCSPLDLRRLSGPLP